MSDWTFPKGDLMKGKRGLVMGAANDRSIAWGISQQLAAQGAEIAFTYQGEALERRVRPLIESIGMKTMISADVTNDAEMDAAFASLKSMWGSLDFLVHAIAFAGKEELQGSFVANTTREGFRRAMDISVFSFVDASRRASEIMGEGGSIVTMTYLGAEPPKASASMRYQPARCARWRWPAYAAASSS
jgi:enoyl-[acyl-carrier protein] reductase I